MVVDDKEIRTIVHQEVSSIKVNIMNIFDTTKRIEEQTKKTNGRVGEVEDKVRDLEEDVRHRAESCPYSSEIQVLRENLLTGAALKQFMSDQKKDQADVVRDEMIRKQGEDARHQKRLELLISFGILLITIITVAVNILL